MTAHPRTNPSPPRTPVAPAARGWRPSPASRLALALLVVAAALWLAPEPAPAQDRTGLTVEVYLKNGETKVLRDARFVRLGKGERPPKGSAPPGLDPGDFPGSVPGGEGGDGTDYTGPGSQGVGGGRVGGTFGGGSRGHPGRTDLRTNRRTRLEAIDIVRVEEEDAWGDIRYRNGDYRPNVKLSWNGVMGWDRPGNQGDAHVYRAEEIREVRFPEF